MCIGLSTAKVLGLRQKPSGTWGPKSLRACPRVTEISITALSTVTNPLSRESQADYMFGSSVLIRAYCHTHLIHGVAKQLCSQLQLHYHGPGQCPRLERQPPEQAKKKLPVPGGIRQTFCTDSVCDKETRTPSRLQCLYVVLAITEPLPRFPPLSHVHQSTVVIYSCQSVPTDDFDSLSSIACQMDVGTLVSGRTYSPLNAPTYPSSAPVHHHRACWGTLALLPTSADGGRNHEIH
ncbi:hypothetical protein BD779DRAFT_1685135 [Infundibulicybe gibba]|nr:hypothetical protein BD779DRAFT_1685135 [Infundibulicybe gibba]